MKKIFKWVGIVVGLWIVAALIWSGIGGGGDSELVSMVQNGNWNGAPTTQSKKWRMASWHPHDGKAVRR